MREMAGVALVARSCSDAWEREVWSGVRSKAGTIDRLLFTLDAPC
jgi:hypothetical protein